MAKHGMSLVEIMIVVSVGMMILLPTLTFLSSMQKNANKGFERIESLTTARLITQKVQRDLKTLCFSGTKGFEVKKGPDSFECSFPAFPTECYSFIFTKENLNPVNIVKYLFDKKKKTLVRSLEVHPELAGSSNPSFSEILGKNVEDFFIEKRSLFSLPYYEIVVHCQSQHPLLKKEAAHLCTAVRSKFEISFLENSSQIPNLTSRVVLPK